MRGNERGGLSRRLGAIPLAVACLAIGSASALADGGTGAGGAAGGTDALIGAGDDGAGGFTLGGGGGGGAGATGGDGGNGNAPGGAGGTGGAGATAAGGDGEDGQTGDWEIGGGGGGGAHGAVVSASGAIGPLTGGDGGNGGGSTAAGVGGGGGAGGFGASVTAAVPVATSGNISGGDGGAGGGASDAYHGGGGGSGGIGIAFGAGGASLVNGFTIQAGSGGAGGTALVDAASTGGAGGNGGSGVSGSDLTMTNTGSIIGGSGGSGGAGTAQSGAHGAGGAGIVGSGLAITTSGAISGGLGGDGSTRADALTLLGGANSLTLQSGWSLTGDIATSGTGTTLTLGLDGIDATVANTITGSAAVVVDVAGRALALTGANTYTGGTTVSAGTLRINSDGALGDASGGVTLSDGGALKWDAAFDSARDFTLGTGGGVIDTGGLGGVTLSGDITGAGGLTVRAGTSVTLSGSNDYTGPTHIESGILRISSNDALNGTTALTVDADATLEINGFLRQVSVGSIAGDGLVRGAGGILQFFVWGSDNTNTSFGGTIDGDTIFASKQGTGITTLTGENDFQSFVVNEGTIKMGDGGVLGARTDLSLFGSSKLDLDGNSITIDSLIGEATAQVSLGSGTLTLDHASGSIHYFGAIEGTGGIVKEGAGTQVLAGDNDFTGASSVNEGTLQIGAGADAGTFTGDVSVAAGATFAFDRTGETTYAGTLSGNGGFTKSGAGALNYTGSSALFAGTTRVLAGRLAVDGALGGTVEVGDGASLGGTGTVGALKVGDGGTLGPGNSIGTLGVVGNAVFETGSTFAVEVGNVSADRLTAGGTATIEAGAAIDLELDGAYPAGARYTLISSSSLTGRFDTVTGDVGAVSAFFTADLVYDEDALYLDVAQARRFADVARTPNQIRTATALNTLPVGNPLFQAVALLPDEASAQSAFDLLSGDVNATVRGLFVENSAFTRRAMIDRLRAAQGGVGASTAPVMSYAAPSGPAGAPFETLQLKAAPATTSSPVLWGQGYGAWTDLDGSANAAGLTSDTGGFLIGLDTALSAGWRLGVMGGYGYTSFDSGARNASGSSDDWMIGAYAGNKWGALALRTGLAYAWQDVSSSRSVSFPGFAETLKADYDAGTFQAFGELGYTVEAGFAAFEPFANLAYVSLNTGGFSETGGSATLTMGAETTDTAFSTLGVRLAREVALGPLEATLRGTLGWRHAFGDVTPELTQSYVGSAPFTVTGVPIAEDAALVEAGLDLALSPAATLGVAYSGQFGDGTSQNGVNATIRVSF